MDDKVQNPLSPTLNKVLDEYLGVLLADKEIDDSAAKRLDSFIRKGKVPKVEDFDTALDPTPKGARSDPDKDHPYRRVPRHQEAKS